MLVQQRGRFRGPRSTARDAIVTSMTAVTLAIVLLTEFWLCCRRKQCRLAQLPLPRIEHWVNRILAYFPIPTCRQLSLNPLGEMLVAHFRVLAAGDRYDNVVQNLASPAASWPRDRAPSRPPSDAVCGLLSPRNPWRSWKRPQRRTTWSSPFPACHVGRLLACASRTTRTGLHGGSARSGDLAKPTAYLSRAVVLFLLAIIVRDRIGAGSQPATRWRQSFW